MNSSKKEKIVIATINKEHNKIIKSQKYLKNYDIIIVNSRSDLNKKLSNKINKVFFLHWRWKVSQKIIKNFCCICFHMTKLPFGRGGSPLQNLILLDKKNTHLTAFMMTNLMDEGPVYYRNKLNLAGSADEIYKRAAILSLKMISKILKTKKKPKKQTGKITFFKRRTPSQSEIKNIKSLNKLYNFIRMLDAPNYPKAYIMMNTYKITFSNAKLHKKTLSTCVTIEKGKIKK